MRTNDSDLFFTCSLIELIGRTTCQKRSATVELLGRKIVSHVYANAGILHCEPIAKTAEKFIELTKIPQGVFDNVSLCKYDVPSYWTIGKVYSRLIEDVEEGDIIDALFKVYTSPISDDISNYNSDFFYQPRDFIKEQFLNWLNLNSQKTDKKPAIRFRGFTDSWEQRKLGDVAGIYDGVHHTPDYKNHGVMFLSVENIMTMRSAKYISEDDFKRDYRIYPQKGDILMTRIGDVGTPGVVETNENIAYYVSLALLKPLNIDSFFLCYLIQSRPFQQGLKDRTLTTAIPQKINKEEIGKVPFLTSLFPSEQKIIGAFFRNLDHLITLHQRE